MNAAICVYYINGIKSVAFIYTYLCNYKWDIYGHAYVQTLNYMYIHLLVKCCTQSATTSGHFQMRALVCGADYFSYFNNTSISVHQISANFHFASLPHFYWQIATDNCDSQRHSGPPGHGACNKVLMCIWTTVQAQQLNYK